MTTVVDPLGTPVPVYNRSGTSIVHMNASGTTQGGAAAIPRVSGETVAVVTSNDPSDISVKLPDDAEIGDVVEVYFLPANEAAKTFPPSGESLNNLSTDASMDTSVTGAYGGRCRWRKVSATNWRGVGG